MRSLHFEADAYMNKQFFVAIRCVEISLASSDERRSSGDAVMAFGISTETHKLFSRNEAMKEERVYVVGDVNQSFGAVFVRTVVLAPVQGAVDELVPQEIIVEIIILIKGRARFWKPSPINYRHIACSSTGVNICLTGWKDENCRTGLVVSYDAEPLTTGLLGDVSLLGYLDSENQVKATWSPYSRRLGNNCSDFVIISSYIIYSRVTKRLVDMQYTINQYCNLERSQGSDRVERLVCVNDRLLHRRNSLPLIRRVE
uniref:CPSF_A domain-containing protein n=1 Tax=Angiostrongylus cantonensis TaxID=6313 RepID=A0A0K0D4W7_ANGCA